MSQWRIHFNLIDYIGRQDINDHNDKVTKVVIAQGSNESAEVK